MTTPERQKRRQLVEGAALIAIGLLMLGQSLYFNAESRGQRQCLTDNFQELSVALDARAELIDRETAQNKRLWDIYARAAGVAESDDQDGYDLTPEDKARFQEMLVKELFRYQDTIRTIERERRENPLPPYPIGECG